MQIRTLVFIGIACIISSMALYFYLNMDTLFDNLKTVKKRILHEKETKQTLVEIDTKSKEKLEKAATKAAVATIATQPQPSQQPQPPTTPSTKSVISSDVEELNKELEKLKRDLEKHSKFDGGHTRNNMSQTDKTYGAQPTSAHSYAPVPVQEQSVAQKKEEVFYFFKKIGR